MPVTEDFDALLEAKNNELYAIQNKLLSSPPKVSIATYTQKKRGSKNALLLCLHYLEYANPHTKELQHWHNSLICAICDLGRSERR